MSEEWLSAEETREVLARLSAMEEDLATLNPAKERHSVLAVAEVLDLPEWQILEVAKAIREERAVLALREIEEPLYRVERPGTPPPDPLARSQIGGHLKSIRTILDRVTPEGEVSRKPRRDLRESKAEALAHRIILGLTVLVGIGVAYAILRAILGLP